MHARSVRLHAALRAASEWQSVETVEELAGVCCASIGRFVAADGVGWNEVDLVTGRVTVVHDPPHYGSVPLLETLTRLIHQNPLVEHVSRTGDMSAHTFSDFVSVRELHRKEIYTDFYRPLDTEDQLATIVQADRTPLIGIALNRPRRTFTQTDRTLLDLLRPHVIASYRTIGARAEARRRMSALERGLEAAGHGVAVLTPEGAIADVSPGARRLLARWLEAGTAPAAGVYESDATQLTVRRVGGDPPLLLLDERRLRPDPARARALGLTAREAEVVGLAGRGIGDAEIAAELFLSVRTVQKHLEHAFRKLGVHGRREAAAKLLDAEDR